jgi:hypothetical protein
MEQEEEKPKWSWKNVGRNIAKWDSQDWYYVFFTVLIIMAAFMYHNDMHQCSVANQELVNLCRAHGCFDNDLNMSFSFNMSNLNIYMNQQQNMNGSG